MPKRNLFGKLERYFCISAALKAVSENPFLLKHCHNRYTTQEICDTVVDDFILALKFVPDRFVTSNITKKLHNVLFKDDGMLISDV